MKKTTKDNPEKSASELCGELLENLHKIQVETAVLAVNLGFLENLIRLMPVDEDKVGGTS